MQEVTLDFSLLILIRVAIILSVLMSLAALAMLIRGTHVRGQPRDRNDTIVLGIVFTVVFGTTCLLWFKEHTMQDEFCEKYAKQDIERITPWLRN